MMFTQELIESNPQSVQDIVDKLIILKVGTVGEGTADKFMEVVGVHPSFDVATDIDNPPMYTYEFNEDGEGRFKKCDD